MRVNVKNYLYRHFDNMLILQTEYDTILYIYCPSECIYNDNISRFYCYRENIIKRAFLNKVVYEDDIAINFEVDIYLKYLTASLNKTIKKWYHNKYHKTAEEWEIGYIQEHLKNGSAILCKSLGNYFDCVIFITN